MSGMTARSQRSCNAGSETTAREGLSAGASRSPPRPSPLRSLWRPAPPSPRTRTPLDGPEPVTRSTGRPAAAGDDARGEGRADDGRPGRGAVGVLQRSDRAAGHPRAADGGRRERASPRAAGDRGPTTRRRRCRPASALGRDMGPGRRAPYAETVAEEARATGHEMLLGPGSRRVRQPYWGRAGENPGEDPFLIASITTPYVQEVQERQRHREPQALRRLPAGGGPRHRPEHGHRRSRADGDLDAPLPGRDREGRPRLGMCSFNKINGDYACESDYALETALRERLGFDGFVITDFGALHSTEPSIRAGTDMETGTRRLLRGAAAGGRPGRRPSRSLSSTGASCGSSARCSRSACSTPSTRCRRSRCRSTAPSPARSRRTRSRF